MTSKEIYCQSDFVSKAKILDKIPRISSNDTIKNQNIRGITYKVKHLQILKKDSTKPFPNEIITASNSALCGVNWLEVGKEYYLLGDQEKNSLFIESSFELNVFNHIQIKKKNSNNYYESNTKMNEIINEKVNDNNYETTKNAKCIYCKKLRDFEGWD
ncbi:Netrin domain and Proteinase inhibitor I35, tissue inhibitor of metalloproteinase family and Tissue inhibitor of metalloproteinases-like, OB-fold domain-containing protein [Strongyloides ratti]|uniref:Netrin domain and Proteinase inhibitor I35, tissue inhibitor of metalloproteinase family and Tissue inhibitor of metalloproteinases-like, OB-fold domain-containing protein n=1 Tax=Strongyloides ratti TaxID=34506 RepID=A0A090LPG4_STRRB|nr:Netrin domain and Proteinase inhibitor I35, tissue inhibitor of metalloproteinase family and Tissue inhibitor of metalloproteinases-like, OB-fold domain-containing protein [Strongyloides ratti]CEF69430.1 Netrin domain and Proteinase inhibitor I35, tissue inhibitor of metalloproteinase family and Tissue inhibitor of metalloproteinases-like, OB-fold domain-containing protein [Strongyloides ratti]